jgi:hypothetical protein
MPGRRTGTLPGRGTAPRRRPLGSRPARPARSPRAIAATLCAALVYALAAAVAPGPAAASPPAVAPGLTQAAAEQLGIRAYEYGIPLMEFLSQARRQTSVTVPDRTSDAPVNQLGNARDLAHASDQVIVQPNSDTLYTMGHLDLTGTALVFHVPAIAGGRYYSFEFLDPYTNVFHYIGTRTTGDGAGTFLITGPSFAGRAPAGMRRIRSAYDRVWLVGRTLVNGPGDLPAVHRIQDGYRLIPLAGYRARGLAWQAPRPERVITRPRAAAPPAGLPFFDALGAALAANPPPRRDALLLRRLRAVGIGPGLRPSREHLSAPVRAGLAEAVGNGYAQVQALRTSLAARSVATHRGWFVPPGLNGAFGTHYTYRAVVALFGIAANRPAEALYIIGVASQGHPGLLDGSHDYVIHFAAGRLPPARFFWSLTMYNSLFRLVANPIDRYALGSHTRGLVRNPDGSLDIYLQHSPPPGHLANWLPAPAGTFAVTLRLYGPRQSALSDRYAYPPIVQTN